MRGCEGLIESLIENAFGTRSDVSVFRSILCVRSHDGGIRISKLPRYKRARKDYRGIHLLQYLDVAVGRDGRL